MNLCPVSVVLLFLCFLNTFIAASDHPTHFISDACINCGSSGTSAARSGREWQGDVQNKFSSSIEVKGSSTSSSVIHHKFILGDDPVPYKTARVSRSAFSYAFQVNPGQKILRLHFNPSSYKGFERFKDFFTVEAGPFTLLSNFSASLTADALGVNSFMKEFCINFEENQLLNIIFSPASNQLLDTYAFVNGIEIISVPASLSYFHMGDLGVQLVGKSPVYIDNRTALEIVHRQHIKQDFTSSSTDDIGDGFGTWETISQQKGNRINDIIWKISVDVGFRYLVRLHFFRLGFKMAEIGGYTFEVRINGMIADTNIDRVQERDDNSIPRYRDYMLVMTGSKQEGKHDILICMRTNDDFMDGHAPLKGFEVVKLSNPDNSLASPNPLPLAHDSSHLIAQNILKVFGHRNVTANIAVALLVLVNIIIYALWLIWEATDTEEENMPSATARQLCRRISLAEIKFATRNFSSAHLIGKGGFGKVYEGFIDNGQVMVAIKRLKSNSTQGTREFLTEIETLTKLRHVNLVSLIGYCNECKEMILVYEYMARGTLADYLYKLGRNSENGSSLTWKQRLNICIEAGRGLDYLHTGHSIIHRDVKASNILLDEDFTAKVSDFGLAKHLSRSKSQSHVSTKVKGTPGYFDPEYLNTGKLTRKSDTYAFGVVLLEVLSGRKAVDRFVTKDEQILTKWARESISKGKAGQIAASSLRNEISDESLMAFVGVAESCLLDEPKKRPTMAQVVAQLEIARELQVSSKSSIPNGISSGVDDTHSSNDKTNSSVSSEHLNMDPSDTQNLTPHHKGEVNHKTINAERPSDGRDGRKASAHKSSRLSRWDAFWNWVKPSRKNELLLSDDLRGRGAQEAKAKDKQKLNFDSKSHNQAIDSEAYCCPCNPNQ